MATYTVISCSGWQGSDWMWRGEFPTRREAEAFAAEIHVPNARSDGYMTAVIGGTQTCDRHDSAYHPNCAIGDTSRVRVFDRHLRSRRAHIDLSRYGTVEA